MLALYCTVYNEHVSNVRIVNLRGKHCRKSLLCCGRRIDEVELFEINACKRSTLHPPRLYFFLRQRKVKNPYTVFHLYVELSEMSLSIGVNDTHKDKHAKANRVPPPITPIIEQP